MPRHACFTAFCAEAPGHKGARYAVYQREQAKTGREHWQGYIEFDRNMTVKQIQAVLGCNAHVETRKGTREQARNYCMKEETRLFGPFEHGEWITGQGSRSDVKNMTDMIRKGKSEAYIAEHNPAGYMRMYRGIRELKSVIEPDRYFKTHVRVNYGTGTGQGKSLNAFYLAEGHETFVMTDKNNWWDGYSGQEFVIWDDFEPSTADRTFMLNIMDRYPFRVPIKGSSRKFTSSYLIITTNHHPWAWYGSDYGEHIMRRIDIFDNFDQVDNENLGCFHEWVA